MSGRRTELAWAYLSRVAEAPCAEVAALVRRVGPDEAAERIRRGAVDEAVAEGDNPAPRNLTVPGAQLFRETAGRFANDGQRVQDCITNGLLRLETLAVQGRAKLHYVGRGGEAIRDPRPLSRPVAATVW